MVHYLSLFYLFAISSPNYFAMTINFMQKTRNRHCRTIPLYHYWLSNQSDNSKAECILLIANIIVAKSNEKVLCQRNNCTSYEQCFIMIKRKYDNIQIRVWIERYSIELYM